MLLNTLIAALGILLVTVEGPHEKHIEEVSQYVQFGLWWIVLGVASSIGLGCLKSSFKTMADISDVKWYLRNIQFLLH
ncbi:hypothetical protein V6N12_009359 [Hibiscus sabdariffa]|uniref:Magnesium transporter n=1 Tax=Hibiscus sabdariffa TaxID=183260 RepID=A0ABR2ECH4_9ROSI